MSHDPAAHQHTHVSSDVPLDGVRAVVVTVSDRCAAGVAVDTAGPAIAEALSGSGAAATVTVVPDGLEPVSTAITEALAAAARIVITTGGTGVSPRDVTPEATRPLLARELPGIPEALRTAAREATPAAALGRGLAGVTDTSPPAVIVNVPGSETAARESMDVLTPLLPHLLSQLDGGDH